MRRAESGRLVGRHSVFLPDPDWLDDEVEKLVISTSFDATLLHARDPAKVLSNRIFMKATLSRYGRIDPHSWEHRDLFEMQQYFDAVIDLIRREGSGTEDR